MARPLKEGLEYFSFDVDITEDDKVKLIKAKYGMIGFAVFVLLLTKIYKKSYFYTWSEDEEYLLADETKIDVNDVKNIVNDCINKGLFSNKLFNDYGILTSKGIQKRYLQGASKRKKIILISEYFIANDCIKDLKLNNVEFTKVSSDINETKTELITEEIPQSKVKESKVKESKVTTPTPPEESAAKSDTPVSEESGGGNYKTVIAFIQKNLCLITNDIQNQKVISWIKELPEDWILEAVKIAAMKPGRTLNYVDSILVRWQAQYKPDERPWEVEHGRNKGCTSDGGYKKSNAYRCGGQGNHETDGSKTDWENEPESFDFGRDRKQG